MPQHLSVIQYLIYFKLQLMKASQLLRFLLQMDQHDFHSKKSDHQMHCYSCC